MAYYRVVIGILMPYYTVITRSYLARPNYGAESYFLLYSCVFRVDLRYLHNRAGLCAVLRGQMTRILAPLALNLQFSFRETINGTLLPRYSRRERVRPLREPKHGP